MSGKHEAVLVTCPRCGVVYRMMEKTIRKNRERGKSDWDSKICVDCKPAWVRSNRVTPTEIWEAYCKDKGIA